MGRDGKLRFVSVVRFSKAVALYGLLGVAFLIARESHAERVITDYEARRLTLSALTALPMARNSVMHRRIVPSRRNTTAHRARLANTASVGAPVRNIPVRNVAYHGRVMTPHRRNSHSRHG